MKPIVFILLLLSSSLRQYAQERPAISRVYDVPADKITRTYIIDLGKGNTLRLDLADRAMLNYVNLDSLVTVFKANIDMLKDSLQEDVSKHIYFRVEPTGRNKLLIRHFRSEATYIIDQGSPAILAIDKDTVTITGSISKGGSPALKVQQFYKLTFYLHQLNDLFTVYAGHLQEKMHELLAGTWGKTKDGYRSLNTNPLIQQKIPADAPAVYAVFDAGVSVQNFKNFFVPGFMVSAGVMKTGSVYRNKVDISADFLYLFAPEVPSVPQLNPEPGKMKTYQNTFVTLHYERTRVKAKNTTFPLSISVGIPITRNGDYFDSGTIQWGIGKVSFLGGSALLEPLIYSKDFFSAVTPGVRVVVQF